LPKALRYWTVARTNWREEQRAAHHVERQGFEFYLPQMYEPRRGGDEEKRTLFFPGHIFIRLMDGWERLCNTRGIQKLFMVPPSYDRPDEFVPARLRDEEVSYLKSLQDENEVCRLPPIPDGTLVRVKPGTGGAYDGITGIVAGTTARGRVEILLRILGRDFKREFSRSALQAA
jgi:transcriptional antiterminator RfaH